MADFLKINGIKVYVQHGTFDLDQEDIGETHRAEDGTPLFNRRATKRRWGYRTIVQPAATALALRDLVTGKGHVVSFENQNLYSSKGLAPNSVGGNTGIISTAPGAKFGTYYLHGHTSDNLVTWIAFTSTSPWTVGLWYYEAATWKHLVRRSDGAKWFNGVRNDAGATPFLTVSNGVVSVGEEGVDGKFDDLVMLPTSVPDDWPAQMYAFNTAFPDLPSLKASGESIEQNATISVKGVAGKLSAVVGNSLGTGTKQKNLQSFAFRLDEN